MFSLYQGETIYINITVKDSAGANANLTGATAKFICTKGSESVHKACTIASNIVTAKLLPSDTETMIGRYDYEVKIQDSAGDVDTLIKDVFEVKKSVMPDYTVG